MSGRPRSDELRAAWNFLGGGDLHEANLPVFGVDEASFGERVFCFDVGPMLLDQIIDADADGAACALLAGLGDINHIPVERDIEALQLQHQH